MNKTEFNLPKFRRNLHEFPEISGHEEKTSMSLEKTLKQFEPDEIISGLGGYGLAVTFDSKRPGPIIMIRAELDALPIQEVNELIYRSKNPGVSHSCGHDGHMTILIGLAIWLQKEMKNLHGKVVLLFQPAEENAEGAKHILNDPKFKSIRPDYIFALHNIPGFEHGSIIVKKGIFASASKGFIINLIGKTSHAAHPENGNNPVLAMIEIIQSLLNIPKSTIFNSHLALITIIHARLGGAYFGTSPGDATIMATFRSHLNEHMQIMSSKAENLVQNIADNHRLDYNIDWVEQFPAIVNNDECVDVVVSSAKVLGKDILIAEPPFPWSEDFSYFTQNIKGALFGIGSGINHPQLHNADYDFPDEILDTGVCLFKEIIRKILEK